MVEPLKNLEKFYQVRFEAAQAESELGARIIDEPSHKLSDKQYCFFGFGHESIVKNNLIFVAILTLLLFIPTFGISQIAEQNMDVKLSSHLPLLNASTFLNIPTTDNSEQACHPSIIDFKNEYNKSAWHGYRYWMAYTPYTNGSNSVENPSLIASNNGIDWVVPTGISNPLVHYPGSPSFNCDPDLIYNSDKDELWLYYRFIDRAHSKGYTRLIIIHHDLSKTTPIDVYINSTLTNTSMVSPCIWRESSNQWHMWAVDTAYPQPMMYSHSTDGIMWSPLERCRNSANQDPLPTLGYHAWHPCCKPNYKEKRVEFLISANTLGHSSVSTCKYLFYAQCAMDTPSEINTPIASPILVKSSASNWDNSIIYRSTFEIVDQDSVYKYRIWYSGANLSINWHIGYIEGYLGTTYTPKPSAVTNYSATNTISLSCVPNPILSEAKITYFNKNACSVSLCVFDLNGTKIKTLLDGALDAGNYTYDYNTDGLAKGIYFLVLTAGNEKHIKKIIKL